VRRGGDGRDDVENCRKKRLAVAHRREDGFGQAVDERAVGGLADFQRALKGGGGEGGEGVTCGTEEKESRQRRSRMASLKSSK
jgi:hypothetical protein